MRWYNYAAIFAAGVLFVNAVPHYVRGVSGDRFPTPFAKPPGKGLSSPVVNVLWALFNLAVAYWMARAGRVFGGEGAIEGVLLAGMAGMSILSGMTFAKKNAQ